MKHYVYILKSQKDGTYYKGYSQNFMNRLAEHNSGKCSYTSKKLPWELVCVEECESKAEALKREKSLKRSNMKYLGWLIEQPSNIVK